MTATHGLGGELAQLATAVAALEIVTAEDVVVTFPRKVNFFV